MCGCKAESFSYQGRATPLKYRFIGIESALQNLYVQMTRETFFAKLNTFRYSPERLLRLTTWNFISFARARNLFLSTHRSVHFIFNENKASLEKWKYMFRYKPRNNHITSILYIGYNSLYNASSLGNVIEMTGQERKSLLKTISLIITIHCSA